MRRRLMTNATKLIGSLSADDRGATSIEYGLLASLIAIASIQALDTIGTALNDTFDKASTGLAAAGASAPEPPVAAADEPSVAAAKAAPPPPAPTG